MKRFKLASHQRTRCHPQFNYSRVIWNDALSSFGCIQLPNNNDAIRCESVINHRKKGEMMQRRWEEQKYRYPSLTINSRIAQNPKFSTQICTIQNNSTTFSGIFRRPGHRSQIKRSEKHRTKQTPHSNDFSATFSPLIVWFAFGLYLMTICLLR